MYCSGTFCIFLGIFEVEARIVFEDDDDEGAEEEERGTVVRTEGADAMDVRFKYTNLMIMIRENSCNLHEIKFHFCKYK
jgi:hypothetical protein